VWWLVVHSLGRFTAAGAIVLLALATPSAGIAIRAADLNVFPRWSNDEGPEDEDGSVPVGGGASTGPQGAVASHLGAPSRVARERWVRFA
jgi:hypothetical protein